MPYVTFGYAGATRMAVTVRANLKDENYFAPGAGRTTRIRAAGGGNGRPNRENGRLVGLFHALKGSALPSGYPMRRTPQRLLFLTGKSPLAQLPQRNFATHRLAIGLA
jgi:hypothetical protein